MSRLAVAVERQQWTVVALHLLLGVAEAASKLPPDSLNGLLEVLEGTPRRGRR
jgi:hypothetical protein